MMPSLLSAGAQDDQSPPAAVAQQVAEEQTVPNEDGPEQDTPDQDMPEQNTPDPNMPEQDGTAQAGTEQPRTVQDQTEHARRITFEVTRKIDIGFLVYLPADYEKDAAKRWPLLVFLHGAGERGDDLSRVKIHGPAKHASQGRDFPFIILAPQCPENQWWDIEALKVLLDSFLDQHRVDRQRIYLTGLSMGGYGTWSWAIDQPERFAAIAPICGGGTPHLAARLKSVPVWAFHGGKDPVINPEESQRMVRAVTDAGGNARLTIYPDATHDSWSITYENQELFDWLLSHRRTAPDSKD